MTSPRSDFRSVSAPLSPPPGRGLRRRLRTFWLAAPLACLLVLCVAAGAISSLAFADASNDALARSFSLVTAAGAVLLVGNSLRSGRLDRRTRRAWRLVAAGLVALVLADLAAAIAWSGLLDGFEPLVTAAARLGYQATVVGGLLLLPSGLHGARARGRFGLDAATIGVGGGLVIWSFVVSPSLLAQSSLSGLALAIVPSALDVLGLVAAAKALMRRPAGPVRRAIDLLAFGLVLQFALHVLGAVEGVRLSRLAGGVGGALAQIVVLCLALGADLAIRRPRRPGLAASEGAAGGLGFLPYLFVMLGAGALAAGLGTASATALGTTGCVAGAMLLTGLVLARQLMSARDFAALRAEEASRSSERRFRSLVQSASDAIVVLDGDETVIYASPAADRVFRVPTERMTGRTLADVLELTEPKSLRAIFDEARGLPARHTPPRAWSYRSAEGAQVRLESTATDLTADAHVRGIVLNTRDVSDRHALEVQLMHQAFHDGLTGLPNRALFRDRVDHALARAWRTPLRVAVLFVDLDHFKTVNDSVGHDQGDRLLVSAAQRLGKCLRSGDTASRLGGDEFGVLLEGVQDIEQVDMVCQRITLALRAPFALEEREVTVSASVGVAIAVDGDDADVLLRNADVAMYRAKEAGRGRHEMFEPSMHAVALARLDLREGLEHAVERGEMYVHYQPMVELATGRTVGVEALCRWTRAGAGPVPPTTFIPVAEQTGQIVRIGRYVLDRACRDARRWLDVIDPTRPFSVTVNLSVRQLQEDGLVEEVAHALASSRLPASCLVLELTESVLAQDSDGILGVLTNLKSLGVRLAIDDFGTGYSSLSYLRRFPIDILKVAKSFVDDIRETGGGEALAKAILSMASNLSLDTVAEGIETTVQAEKLRELGCRLGQGYLFDPAISADEIPAKFGVSGPRPLRPSR